MTYHKITIALLLLAGGSFTSENVFAEAPTVAGQVPYIIILSDTSRSMEYTDEGDEKYPRSTLLPGPDVWIPKTDMGVPQTAGGAPGPESFGPCMVWEPPSCESYLRPSWNASISEGGASIDSNWMPEYNSAASGDMKARFDNMRGSDITGRGPVRFGPQNKPRHVMIKELLTGDMILFPETALGSSPDILSYSANAYGPGCWFVPRQREASGEPGNNPSICGQGAAADKEPFEGLPDHKEPTPHFQEVYSGQLRNGIMDTLSGSAIFAVVGFDGYKDNFNWDIKNATNSNQNQLNDGIKNFTSFASAPEVAGKIEGGNCDSGRCYDLGVFRVTGPNNLEIPGRFLAEVSNYSQIVLKDYGYLHRGISGTNYGDWILDPASNSTKFFGETFSSGVQPFLSKQDLGKQPLGGATPVAAAMHDLYGFFAEGQKQAGLNSTKQNPINEDKFKECRPKHIVLLSDGEPTPERGTPSIEAAFDIQKDRFIYAKSTHEIEALVNDDLNRIPPSAGGFNEKYSVRVHVVGLNIGDDEALDQLTEMAKSGKTCAGRAFPDTWNGVRSGGGWSCPNKVVTGGPCLIRSGPSAEYSYPAPDGNNYTCKYPALILDTNKKEDLQGALSILFNGIVGNAKVATRTRAVVTNSIQDDTKPKGGQNRVFSGLSVGGSQYWKGLLNRQLSECTGGFENTELHNDIAKQVKLFATGTNLPQDNRRIFTSIPHQDRYIYDAHPAYRDEILIGSITNSNTIVSEYKYAWASDGVDEFGSVRLDTSTHIGTRVMFEEYGLTNGTPASFDATHVTGISTQTRVEEIVDSFAGRIPEKVGTAHGGILTDGSRTLGGILNSNPVIVAQPSLDLPIDSYRQFKARYANRHTMLYSNTVDGLLHAIHLGERQVQVRAYEDRTMIGKVDTPGDADKMREAWAYVPSMLLRKLNSSAATQAYLLDGPTVVQDVRLCRAESSFNWGICKKGEGTMQPWEQWKTVLIQSAGLAGSGYYAMDITRPGGMVEDHLGVLKLQAPDPIPLWEFTPDDEQQQVKLLKDRGGSVGEVFGDTDLICPDAETFLASTMMGTSISEPAIANLLMKFQDSNGEPVIAQRPVVVFGGGGTSLDPVTASSCAPSGGAIYVLDLQTGSLLRRFTSYLEGASETPFAKQGDIIQLTGSPSLFDGSPGSVATRGFIGGSRGRLFRMDFTNPDPKEWKVELFFDPKSSDAVDQARSAANTYGLRLGPAGYKPAVASTADKAVIVTYGLGDTKDTVTHDEAEIVVALKDLGADKPPVLQWVEALSQDEKLMGSPLTFDSITYWPTYYVPDGDACAPGLARIYGVKYDNEENISNEPVGIWNLVPEIKDRTDILPPIASRKKWWGPKESTLIRGLTITMGNPCNVSGIGTTNPEYDDSDSGERAKPQLIVQTSGHDVADSNLKNRNGNTGINSNSVVDRLVVNLNAPKSRFQPLYWSSISY